MDGLTTSQRTCKFYLTWATRLYEAGECGWVVARTPDDQPIMYQDSFFWFAVEVIAKEWNVIRAEEMAKMTKG